MGFNSGFKGLTASYIGRGVGKRDRTQSVSLSRLLTGSGTADYARPFPLFLDSLSVIV